MEMNPQRVRGADFKTVRKGADPDEVRLFLDDVAAELERAQNQATAMEARARAAVARLQEVTENPPAGGDPTSVEASVEESETISRTLLLAQRTADAAVAEARSKATLIVRQANDEAAATLDSTREMASQMIEEARTDALKVGEAERSSIAEEVEALKARRDFLESDVHHLETFLADQRARVRDAGTELIGIADRVVGGLAGTRPPLLSASDDDDADDEQAEVIVGDGGTDTAAETAAEDDEILIVTEIADDEAADDAPGDHVPGDQVPGDQVAGDERSSAPASENKDPWDVTWSPDDPTQALPAVGLEGDERAGSGGPSTSDEFRFSFDDDSAE